MDDSTIYWSVWDEGNGWVELADGSDWKLAEAAWAAAHEAGLVEEWEPVRFVLGGEAGGQRARRFFDAIQAAEEFHVYSETFRAAVDSCRTEADRYQWLPVVVNDPLADESRDYFILNVDGPDVCRDYMVVDPSLAAGRTVVLCSVGDNPPVFSDEAKTALERDCTRLSYLKVGPQQ